VPGAYKRTQWIAREWQRRAQKINTHCNIEINNPDQVPTTDAVSRFTDPLKRVYAVFLSICLSEHHQMIKGQFWAECWKSTNSTNKYSNLKGTISPNTFIAILHIHWRWCSFIIHTNLLLQV